MAVIAKTLAYMSTLYDAYYPPSVLGIAGEEIEPGAIVAYDLSEGTTGRVYNCIPGDANRGYAIGMAKPKEQNHKTYKTDEIVVGVFPGNVVKGFTLDPSGVAAHRPGSPVYHGADGGLDTVQATGARQVGVIVTHGIEQARVHYGVRFGIEGAPGA